MDVDLSGLSFGFSNVVKRKFLQRNEFLNDDSFMNDGDMDFVTGFIGATILGTIKKYKKEELVIPLLSQSGGLSASTGPMIPLGGINDGSAEKSSLDDYDRIPVEDFGLAMLRGMGWKETEGIGLRNKRVVEIREPEVRPRGLGLGAERPQSNKDVLPPSKSKNKSSKALSLRIGAFAVITKGSNKGLYGVIQSFDEDNNRVIMKMAIGTQMTAVSKFYIDLVDAKEYKKKAKILNNEKYEKYKVKQEKHKGSRRKH